MSATSMGAGSKQVVNPPQRGIFPLDHFAECQAAMHTYLECLKEHADRHHECREYSRDYLQCRMDRGLMSSETQLADMGYGPDQVVRNAREYDHQKEKEGFVAGKHIQKRETDSSNSTSSSWWPFGSNSSRGSGESNDSSKTNQ